MRRLTATLLAFSTLIASCAHEVESPAPPATFQVIIDDSFTGDQRTAIAGGFDAWSAAVGRDLTFNYLTESSDNIQAGLAGIPPKRTIYAIMTSDLSTADCVLQASNVACFKAPNRVYYQPDAVAAINAWPKIATHEAGHALGLQHTNMTPSVMVPDVLSMSAVPSSADVDDYCTLQSDGCPNRQIPKPTGH